ncbi:MAG: hypothetical protein H6Q20_2094 [Bacteroidetes bacterium]|jgi:uncharacterized protein YqkB|nr:hypothetical protein [Bacteroidota bacterium]
MTTYESEIKTISSNEEMVFGILSDLNNLEKLAGNPELNDKVKDLQFDADSCSFAVDGFGRIGFRITNREPFKTIKLESDNAPVQVQAWIQLKQVAENDTKMKLTLQAELPAMIKMMVGNKLQQGINTIAELLAKSLNAKA